MDLGKRLRAIRESRGLTQEELAQAIGVSKRQYQRIEDETSSPKRRHLNQLAGALGCDVQDFFVSGTGPSFSSHGSAAPSLEPQSDLALVAMFASAPHEIHDLVRVILDDDREAAQRLSPAFLASLRTLLERLS